MTTTYFRFWTPPLHTLFEVNFRLWSIALLFIQNLRVNSDKSLKNSNYLLQFLIKDTVIS
jgi:hypothetical protein